MVKPLANFQWWKLPKITLWVAQLGQIYRLLELLDEKKISFWKYHLLTPNLRDFKVHMLILDPYGMICPSGFHAVVIFGLGFYFLFKLVWSYCASIAKDIHIVETFTIHVRPSSRKLWTKRITRPIQYVYRPFYILLLLLPIGYAMLHTKGQLISKGLFDVFKSTKKPTN